MDKGSRTRLDACAGESSGFAEDDEAVLAGDVAF